MKNKIIKQKNKLKKKNEIISIFLLNTIKDQTIPRWVKNEAWNKLNKKQENQLFIKTNYKNICFFNKKTKIYKISQTSREILKNFVESGIFSGASSKN